APELQRAGEEADVGRGVLRLEPGDEDRRAECGGEARRVMGEGVAGRRRPGARELQGISARDERPAALGGGRGGRLRGDGRRVEEYERPRGSAGRAGDAGGAAGRRGRAAGHDARGFGTTTRTGRPKLVRLPCPRQWYRERAPTSWAS